MAEETDSKNPGATPSWIKRVPMITGVLAGLAGFLTVRSANMSNQAIYNSNQAVLHQALSSDHWAEYQADSIKRHVDLAALSTGITDPQGKLKLEAESREMLDRQEPAKDLAAMESKLRDEQLNNGASKLAIKDLLDYAGVAAQLGIALSSVAALTKKRTAFSIGVFAGLVAMVITAYAVTLPYVERLISHH